MPQIGWFEILIVVLLAILIIGPKDFPVMVKKIGNWIGSFKRYFKEIQEDVTDIESTFDNEITFEDNNKKTIDKKNKDE